MSRILVALDGSLASGKALQAAVKLARPDGADLTAVAVADIPANPELRQPAVMAVRRQLEECLQAAVLFARSHGVHLDPLLREGHPANEILACAQEQTPAVLVLGNHSQAGPHAGLGTTAERVSSCATCTVMIVR